MVLDGVASVTLDATALRSEVTVVLAILVDLSVRLSRLDNASRDFNLCNQVAGRLGPEVYLP
jgi:hypothetical protein